MIVYYVRRTDTSQYVKRHPDDPRKTDVDPHGNPRWTGERSDALEWTKPGGAYAWVSWWDALWKASHQESPCEIEVDDYEDPTRTIGGDDD